MKTSIPRKNRLGEVSTPGKGNLRAQFLKTHSKQARVGFTLVEMLVSLAVLGLVVVLVAQMMNRASDVIQVSGIQLDIDSQARMVLDRIGSNLGNMVVARGVAPIVVKDAQGGGSLNDGMAFVANARPRDRSDKGIATKDIRMAILGYGVLSGSDARIVSPMLHWGDGTICWNPTPPSPMVSSDIPGALTRAASDLTGSTTQGMIQFQPVAPGIFRLEICFLLDDGTIVTEPPTDTNFPQFSGSNSTPANTYAVALSKETSASPSKRYVKAFIVGIAALDGQTRQLVGSNPDRLEALAKALPNPQPGTTSSSQTPLQAWDFTSAAGATLRAKLATFPGPVLRSLRLYQRTYYLENAQ